MRPGPITLFAALAAGAAGAAVLTGQAAWGDWTSDAPGVVRKITVDSLPPPEMTRPGVAPPRIVPRPANAHLAVPPGFTVAEFAQLDAPRQIRTAPNGDVFAAETDAGRLKLLRITPGADKPARVATFAEHLDRPFGVAFWPPGPNPQWIYVANANSVVRFPYRNGDLAARGAAQTIVPRLAADTRDHSTRDIAFSPDGKFMFVSVGSGSNDAEDMPKKTATATREWQADHGLGAAWDRETDRGDVLVMDPMGQRRSVYAAGIRNCVTLTVQPGTDTLWCAVNERDLMGDNLPPDYVTRVRAHAFYGWPWFYLGDHEDPRHKGERPDLAGKIAMPDVLLQSHSAPLGLVFYDARRGPAAFPPDYVGSAFVGLHGSWNRARRTGYKVVRILMKDGRPTGDYEDFLTGFVANAAGVWGRPVGVAVTPDGALLVADDAGGIVWRVAHETAGKH
jgi:glucose/arabinose dehydrogenase